MRSPVHGHPSAHGSRFVRLVDNFGLCLAFEKGRASSYGLLQLSRRLGALALSTGGVFRW